MTDIQLMNLFPWIFLVVGGLLRAFDFGRHTIPATAWIAPIFLLQFSHQNDPFIGILLVWLALFLAGLFAYRGVIPVPGIAYPFTVGALAIFWALPYLADRLLTGQLVGFPATLIFPTAWVLVEFAMARFSPFGTWSSVAYTQHGNYPLMQLASVTGLWGITFLVTWFGSTFRWAFHSGLGECAVVYGLLIYSVTWSLIMLAGGARLAFHAPKKTVRVAAIGWPEGMVAMQDFFQVLMPDQDNRSLHEQMERSFCDLQQYFLEATRREARAGAKIILWPEINLLVFKEDEAAFLENAKTLAREEQISLLMGIGTIQTGAPRPLENKAVLVDAEGDLAYSYIKSRPVPGWESQLAVRGNGRVLTHDSPSGRLATAICYDLDFPQSIRQVGQLKVDILLVPASDYEAIKNLHYQMAVFRAIENGCSMIRANRWGLSVAVDPLGRILAVLDDFCSEQRVMVAQVPTAGVRTLYTRYGDWFAWVCVAGLLWLMIN